MLTHVCRGWREMFTSRPSLWTDFNCADAEKTRVYLERSKSSPIDLQLDRSCGLFPHDPFLQIIPHAICRLKYLSILTTSDYLQGITDHLFRPAPLLEGLNIQGSTDNPGLNPMLATTLFGGDLSSLRHLCLFSVRTKLPWRNMVNLTTFTLGYVLEPRVTIGQLLDFFESAPCLLDIELTFATPAFGAQNGRLVSLAHLKRLYIYGTHPPSLLLDHLLIPAGAKMTTDLNLPGPRIEDHLPRSLDNLRNLSGFTKICLHFDFERCFASMEFTGPNGRVYMPALSSQPDTTRLVLQSLALLDTSKAKCLEITGGDPHTEDLNQALLSMKNLQTLTLSRCKNLRSSILALNPDSDLMNPIPCPKLEMLVFRTEEQFDTVTMAEVAAARALGGAPLKFVKIINRREFVPKGGVTVLPKHVLDGVRNSLGTGDED